VGPSDYVMAQRFDRDGDGRLNSGERREAIEALKAGVEKEYKWGLEKSGTHNPYRVIQKRGKIVDGEDFSGIPETYPPFKP